MKLYRVSCEIRYEVLCLADSEEEAIEACRDEYAEDELRARMFSDLLDAYSAKEITAADQIPKEWRGSLVYHPGEEDIKAEDALPTEPATT
jgi:hypothetical protein